MLCWHNVVSDTATSPNFLGSQVFHLRCCIEHLLDNKMLLYDRKLRNNIRKKFITILILLDLNMIAVRFNAEGPLRYRLFKTYYLICEIIFKYFRILLKIKKSSPRAFWGVLSAETIEFSIQK